MRNIILISGKMASGKTTLAEEIINTRPNDMYIQTYKFADVIYEIHDSLWDIMGKYDIDKPFVKDRLFLQWLGTEWRRKTFGEDLWARICRNRVDKFLETFNSSDIAQRCKIKPVVIIDDCRFKCEFDMFPDALTVRLTCPEEVRKNRCAAWGDNQNHASETDLDSYDLNGKFGLYLKTDTMSPAECGKRVIEALNAK
jgi:hypothetical protein